MHVFAGTNGIKSSMCPMVSPAGWPSGGPGPILFLNYKCSFFFFVCHYLIFKET